MRHECDNCGEAWAESDIKVRFPNIPDLTKRIEPGGTVPSGECPDCGALVYPIVLAVLPMLEQYAKDLEQFEQVDRRDK